MPEKHFYFAVGATVGSIVCIGVGKLRRDWQKKYHFLQWLYRREPHWFLYFPIVIFLVGLWGLIPDILHLFGILSKEETRSGWFDIFFFHSAFEHIEDSQPIIDRYLNITGQFLLCIICLGCMSYYVFEAKKAMKSQPRINIKKTRRKKLIKCRSDMEGLG